MAEKQNISYPKFSTNRELMPLFLGAIASALPLLGTAIINYFSNDAERMRLNELISGMQPDFFILFIIVSFYAWIQIFTTAHYDENSFSDQNKAYKYYIFFAANLALYTYYAIIFGQLKLNPDFNVHPYLLLFCLSSHVFLFYSVIKEKKKKFWSRAIRLNTLKMENPFKGQKIIIKL